MSAEDNTPEQGNELEEAPSSKLKVKINRRSQADKFIEASLAVPEDPDFEDTAFLHAIFGSATVTVWPTSPAGFGIHEHNRREVPHERNSHG